MAATITNRTSNPIRVASGGTALPFGNVDVSDPFLTSWDSISGGGTGSLTVTLQSSTGPLGTLIDPARTFDQATVTYDPATNASTFTESTFGGPQSAGAAAQPNQILDRLRYNAPTLADGTSALVYASVGFTQSVSDLAPFPTPSTRTTATVTEPNAVVLEVAGASLPGPPPAAPLPPTPPVVPPEIAFSNFGIVNLSTGVLTGTTGEIYDGPVGGIDRSLLLGTGDNLAVASRIPNVFIKTGSGTDAIDVWAGGGDNVLDGGGGSNFLVGGVGRDTFFVDARGADAAVWSTVRNLGAGDAATLWGITPQQFALNWLDNQGAAGATGLTLAATATGRPSVNLTLTGYTTADLGNGRLSLNFGGTPGSEYLYVVAN